MASREPVHAAFSGLVVEGLLLDGAGGGFLGPA